MKTTVLSSILAGVIGLVIGMYVRGPASGEHRVEPRPASGGSTMKSTSTRITAIQKAARGRPGVLPYTEATRAAANWMPKDMRSFLDPRTEAEHAEVQRIVRAGIETQVSYVSKVKAISDLLALMTPENARDIRDAFKDSLTDGYIQQDGWGFFVARYGAVMQREAAEELQHDRYFHRIITHWGALEPAEAAAFVNEMEPGKRRDLVVHEFIGHVGPSDTDYALEVFEWQAPEDQPRLQGVLIEAHVRAGGKEACGQLARDLLSRDDENLRSAGQHALRRTFDLYRARTDQPEERDTWLRSLAPRHLALLDPAKLPEEFRPASFTD